MSRSFERITRIPLRKARGNQMREQRRFQNRFFELSRLMYRSRRWMRVSGAGDVASARRCAGGWPGSPHVDFEASDGSATAATPVWRASSLSVDLSIVECPAPSASSPDERAGQV